MTEVVGKKAPELIWKQNIKRKKMKAALREVRKAASTATHAPQEAHPSLIIVLELQ